MTDERRTRQRDQAGPRAAARRRVDAAAWNDHRVHGHREVARPAQEGQAVRGDLLRLVRRRRRATPTGRVTFVFNGGPGASSAYLHVGAVGPAAGRRSRPTGRCRRCRRSSSHNEESWLAFTDLVFVDPVGTGFSRIDRQGRREEGRRPEERRRRAPRATSADPKEYFGYKRDLESLSRVHGPLALEQRPLGLAGLHRGRELRRLPRRPARPRPPGDGRDRAERRDPHLAGARDRRRSRRATTTCSPGSTACRRWRARRRHHGRSRAFAEGTPLDDVLREAEDVRDRRLHRVPDARRLDAAPRSASASSSRLADLSGCPSTSSPAPRGASRSTSSRASSSATSARCSGSTTRRSR